MRIVTQNRNGPCPLIAICNALVLRGDLELPAHKPSVSYDELVSLLAEELLLRQQPRSADPNGSQNLTDVMNVFPRLNVGLDVNVRFDGVFDFGM